MVYDGVPAPVGLSWLFELWRTYVLEERLTAWHGASTDSPRMHVTARNGEEVVAEHLADLLHNSFQETPELSLVGLAQMSLRHDDADRWLARALAGGGWSLEGLHAYVGDRDVRDLGSRLEAARRIDAQV